MAAPVTAPLPPGLDLQGGYTIKFVALDPTTGAAVSGVNVSAGSLLVDNVAAIPDASLSVGPFMLVPGPSE